MNSLDRSKVISGTVQFDEWRYSDVVTTAHTRAYILSRQNHSRSVYFQVKDFDSGVLGIYIPSFPLHSQPTFL